MPAPVYIGPSPVGLPSHTMSTSYPRRDYGFGSTPGSLRDMIIDSMFDHPTPTSFNSHFAPSSMKSDTADRLPSFEQSFCQGYQCCGLELDDLHHLLEHFEENHVHDLPMDAPKSPQMVIQDLKQRAKIAALQTQSALPSATSAAVIAATLAAANDAATPSYSASPAAVPTPLPPPSVNVVALPAQDTTPRTPSLSADSSTCTSPATPAGASFDMDDVEMDTDEASDDGSSALFEAGRLRSKKRSYASALGRLRGTLDNLNITAATADAARVQNGSASSSRTGSAVPSPIISNLEDPDEDGMDADDATAATSSSTSSLAASGGLPPSAFFPPVTSMSASPPQLVEDTMTTPHAPPINVPGLPADFVPPMPTLPSGRTWVPPAAKPFKCPVPGCDKAYKQQNGLKYHRLHGHCNNRAGTAVGKEAEGRETLDQKPYGCYVGAACGKRYKNLNGLRYHYMHSGEHGQIGLSMITNGTHPTPLLPNDRLTSSNASSRSSSPAAARLPSLPVPTVST